MGVRHPTLIWACTAEGVVVVVVMMVVVGVVGVMATRVGVTVDRREEILSQTW